MKPQKSITRKGFTLIELLVVIAIICLLAAILFPVFARARENAKRANCMSNEKQMALGLIQYSQDYDERFPVYMTATPPGYYCGNVCWSEQIEPYVKNFQIFRCPSRPADKPGTTDVNGSVYQLLYGLPNNGASEIYQSGVSSPTGCHISKIKEPARTFLVVETRDQNQTNYSKSGYGMYGPYFSSAMARPEQSTWYAHDRHLEGSNVAFVDGHVKWVKSGNGNQYIFWNTCNQS